MQMQCDVTAYDVSARKLFVSKFDAVMGPKVYAWGESMFVLKRYAGIMQTAAHSEIFIALGAETRAANDLLHRFAR
jgi:hypothetical protein